jgi:hypothetical protein
MAVGQHRGELLVVTLAKTFSFDFRNGPAGGLRLPGHRLIVNRDDLISQQVPFVAGIHEGESLLFIVLE